MFRSLCIALLLGYSEPKTSDIFNKRFRNAGSGMINHKTLEKEYADSIQNVPIDLFPHRRNQSDFNLDDGNIQDMKELEKLMGDDHPRVEESAAAKALKAKMRMQEAKLKAEEEEMKLKQEQETQRAIAEAEAKKKLEEEEKKRKAEEEEKQRLAAIEAQEKAEKEKLEKLKKEQAERKKEEEAAAEKAKNQTILGNDTATWAPEDVRRYNTHPHESISKEQQEAEEEEKQFEYDLTHKNDSIEYVPEEQIEKEKNQTHTKNGTIEKNQTSENDNKTQQQNTTKIQNDTHVDHKNDSKQGNISHLSNHTIQNDTKKNDTQHQKGNDTVKNQTDLNNQTVDTGDKKNNTSDVPTNNNTGTNDTAPDVPQNTTKKNNTDIPHQNTTKQNDTASQNQTGIDPGKNQTIKKNDSLPVNNHTEKHNSSQNATNQTHDDGKNTTSKNQTHDDHQVPDQHQNTTKNDTVVPPAPVDDSSITVYFGVGCFWHIQHEFYQAERDILHRTDAELTAIAGYGGSVKRPSDGTKRICYHKPFDILHPGQKSANDYGVLGFAEAVQMSIPKSKFKAFAKVYFDQFTAKGDRPDAGDRGSEYRYVIGLPGGMNSDVYKELPQVQGASKFTFKKGAGGDPDNYGKNSIWVYDTKVYKFHQAEVYHQFHDGFLSGQQYGDTYHKLRDALVLDGRLKKTGCPKDEIEKVEPVTPVGPDDHHDQKNDTTGSDNDDGQKPAHKPVPLVPFHNYSATLESFYDLISGNKYSQQFRAIDLNSKDFSETWLLKWQYSLDVFMGLMAGDFPYYSPSVYRANVHDLKAQASVNITSTIKFEILKFYRVEIEFELVPAYISGGLSFYTTSLGEDNCGWTHYSWDVVQYKTKVSQNVPNCQMSVRDQLLKANDWNSALLTLKNDPFWFINPSDLVCDYDQPYPNKEVHELAFPFSGSLFGDVLALPDIVSYLRQEEYITYSYCLGSVDWVKLLVPEKSLDTYDEESYLNQVASDQQISDSIKQKILDGHKDD